MKHNVFFITLTGFVLFSSCKTTEEIRRERLVNDLSVKMAESEKQLRDSKKMTGDQLAQLQTMEEEVARLTGLAEKTEFDNTEKAKKFEQLEQSVYEMQKNIIDMEEEQKKIRSYLNDVIKTLKQIQKGGGSGKSTKMSTYQEAMELYAQGNYKDAKPLLIQLTKGKLADSTKPLVFHNLGVTEYYLKNYDQALTYFSKLATQYPDSTYTPNSYLFLGRSFENLGKNSEAIASYKELIKLFPKSDKVASAEKAIKKLVH